MTENCHSDEEVEFLLRAALPDDLPDEIAFGLRRRIVRFRSESTEGKLRGGERIWIFRRAVWAALAVLMLAAGFLLQGFRTPNPLSRRITEIKAGISNTAPARPPIRKDGAVAAPGKKEA